MTRFYLVTVWWEDRSFFQVFFSLTEAAKYVMNYPRWEITTHEQP